ncbi:hypothetical protein MPNT_80064 [Candidatus Methylacidithermus pantelleriae]|uniref:Uncharacterized protein n=1 Tax=Candidatus Methylacidithermus pantelleriae TaxID=2744239 RepID=A0A8J2BLH1_9BACT|nr:hypothetical protein MPNT_80064 [Candidatus Methylacidithermus pantelleriae]
MSHGRPKAAIVSLEDWELLRRLCHEGPPVGGLPVWSIWTRCATAFAVHGEADCLTPMGIADRIREPRKERTDELTGVR